MWNRIISCTVEFGTIAYLFYHIGKQLYKIRLLKTAVEVTCLAGLDDLLKKNSKQCMFWIRGMLVPADCRTCLSSVICDSNVVGCARCLCSYEHVATRGILGWSVRRMLTNAEWSMTPSLLCAGSDLKLPLPGNFLMDWSAHYLHSMMTLAGTVYSSSQIMHDSHPNPWDFMRIKLLGKFTVGQSTVEYLLPVKTCVTLIGMPEGSEVVPLQLSPLTVQELLVDERRMLVLIVAGTVMAMVINAFTHAEELNVVICWLRSWLGVGEGDRNFEPSIVGDEDVCLICCHAKPSIIFLPCGHLAACSQCAYRLPEQACPICRTVLEYFVSL